MDLTLLAVGFLVVAAPPRFERHDIADYPGAYQVAVADMNGDGRPDVLVLSTQGNTVDGFENPTWRRWPIARTEQNIDLAPRDLDGDGRPELALAFGFHFADGNRGGQIQWLRQGPPGEPWQAHPIAVDPVVHRLRWADLDGDGRPELVHAPIFGPGSKGPAQVRPSHLWAFRPPKPLDADWQKWPIDETLTVLHGLYVGDLDGDGRDELLTASYEGIHRFDFEDGRWQRTAIAPGAPPVDAKPGAARGSSEVVPVRVGRAQPPTVLAAIEPWHGNQLVVYRLADDRHTWARQVLDESLREGHALLACDFDGDGQEEIVAGWRAAGGGIALYDPSPDGRSWTKTPIEIGIAAEGAVVADIDGDGRPDLVVSAGRSRKVVWYRNRAE